MWIIKDDIIQKRTCRYITPLELSDLFESCKDEYVHVQNDTGINILIHKSLFIEAGPYLPGLWYAYPRMRPPGYGHYLVCLTEDYEPRLRIAEYQPLEDQWKKFERSSILAFKKLPPERAAEQFEQSPAQASYDDIPF